MTDPMLEEMGPIDYIVLEWPVGRPREAIADLLIDLVDRDIIRILDVAFLAKDEDGTVTAMEASDVDDFRAFAGASSGLLGDDDISDAAAALEPGTSAVVLVWENRWAAPFAIEVRRSGGQLVASGRIPVQAILASLDAIDPAA
jgi:uncharacterized membrane protein